MNGSAVVELVMYVGLLYTLLYGAGRLLIQADRGDPLPTNSFSTTAVCPHCGRTRRTCQA